MTFYLREPAAHVPLYESVASKLQQEMTGIARQSSSLRNKFVFVLIFPSISVNVNGKNIMWSMFNDIDLHCGKES